MRKKNARGLAVAVVFLTVIAALLGMAGCGGNDGVDGAIAHLRQHLKEFEPSSGELKVDIRPVSYDEAIDVSRDPTTVEDIEVLTNSENVEALYYLLYTAKFDSGSGYEEADFLHLVWREKGSVEFVCGTCLY